ncbi:hypothetical protein, partial [Salmonella enterica]|uniref:hypothetical protein n=1 Tax=Salmonella enterica TaxID=28901 RepID=UPI003D34C399
RGEIGIRRRVLALPVQRVHGPYTTLAGICKDILLSSQSSGLAFTVFAVNVLRYLVSLEKNEK